MTPLRLAAVALGFAIATGDAKAQEEGAAESALSAEDLDTLVAPVALYPDALLAQVLVAATYPLEVVKAARWTEESADVEGEARADAAEAEGWDPSVAVLAAGFPTVVERMAAEIDWTEGLGDAVVTQTDDVMDAVQRQRARAAALGNLESNEAQTVTLDDDAISIAPANPEVVYVPAYDPALAYSAQTTAAPVVVADPDDEGYSSGDLIATGVIAFGAGMLVNELFDDDDDWNNGYWYGPPRFDWDDGGFYPRPGVNIDGDVNINVDRDGIDIDRGDRFRPDPDRAAEARNRLSNREGDGAARERLENVGGGDRADVREKIAARSVGGARPARPASGDRGDATAKLRERAGGGGGGGGAALRRDDDGPLAARRAENRGGGGLRTAAASRKGGELKRADKDRPRASRDRPRPKADGGGGGRRGEAMKRGGGREHAARAGARGGKPKRR
jgi:hypothetical protein